MKIIYKYIVKELIMPMFFSMAAFTGIFIGADILFDLIYYYTNWGLPFAVLIQSFFLKLPPIIVFVLPMATLMGTIMAFGRLAGDGEITACRAGGISIYRLVMPAMVIGLFVSLLTVGINAYLAPMSSYMDRKIIYEARYEQQMPVTQENLILTARDRSGRPDFFLYAGTFDGKTGEIDEVVYQNYKEGRLKNIIEADSAVWKDNQWVFRDGSITYLEAGHRIPEVKFKEHVVRALIYEPQEIGIISKNTEDMNIHELKEYINIRAEQGQDVTADWVNYHERFAVPFASLIFALLASALGIQPRRSGGSATGMGLSIIVIFLYYTIVTVGKAMAQQGVLPPFFGVWIQNFIFLIIGALLLYKTGHRAS